MAHVPGSVFGQVLDQVLGLAFGAAGLTLLASAALNALRGRASVRWPQVTAHVVGLELKESKGGGHSPGRTYTPRVRYRYEAGGAVFEGERLAYVPLSTRDRAEAERFMAQFRLGAGLVVRVCPRHRGWAVVWPGVDRGMVSPFLVGIVLVLVGGHLGLGWL